jgi:putative hydrolase of the HAD superfamily
MASQVPLISISNGTADLALIGLHEHFRFSVSAGEMGVAKPDTGIFVHACERLGIAPEHVLHVGDDPTADVAGARAAGMRTAWINRKAAAWTDATAPDLEVSDLEALATWLLQHKNTTRVQPT